MSNGAQKHTASAPTIIQKRWRHVTLGDGSGYAYINPHPLGPGSHQLYKHVQPSREVASIPKACQCQKWIRKYLEINHVTWNSIPPETLQKQATEWELGKGRHPAQIPNRVARVSHPTPLQKPLLHLQGPLDRKAHESHKSN